MSELKIARWRGKFCVYWYDEVGRRHRRSLGTSNYQAAALAFVEFKRIFESQRVQAEATVAEAYVYYAQERKAEGKAASPRICDAWKQLRSTFENVSVRDVTKELCRSYTHSRQISGASNGTIHIELGYLRAALNFAKRERLITDVPYIPLPRKPPPKDHHLSKAEVLQLLAACLHQHLRLFVILAIATGARSGALLDLTWDRVDLTRRRIVLRDPQKSETAKGRATVPINDSAYVALDKAKSLATTQFVIEWGGHRVSTVKKGIAAASRRSGIRCSPHVLRHTAAVWMAEAGVPMEEIGQYLGHGDITTTRRVYARYSPGYLMRAAHALEL